MRQKIPKLITSLVLCHSAGLIGSLFTISSIDSWYKNLAKPVFSPPNWVFGPVWLVLYTLMGVALYMIWVHDTEATQKRQAFKYFGLQLILNGIWTPIFFGLKQPALGLVILILLNIMVAFTIYKFYFIKKNSGLILVPYFLWIFFALLLNFEIWRLN